MRTKTQILMTIGATCAKTGAHYPYVFEAMKLLKAKPAAWIDFIGHFDAPTMRRLLVKAAEIQHQRENIAPSVFIQSDSAVMVFDQEMQEKK